MEIAANLSGSENHGIMNSTEAIDETELKEPDVLVDDETTGTLNPLLIPEILSVVLNNLPSPRDVHVCRKVCSIWNNEAVKILQQKSVLTLSCPQAVMSYCVIMENTEDFPHQNFKINCNIEFNSLEMIRLFTNFGRTMRTLHLDVWGTENQPCSSSIFKRLSEAQNLETLSIRFHHFCNICWVGDSTNAACLHEDNPFAIMMEDLDIDLLHAMPEMTMQQYFPQNPPLTLPLKNLILEIHNNIGNERVTEIVLRTLISASQSTLESISFESFTANVFLGKIVIRILLDEEIPLEKMKRLNFILKLSDDETRRLVRKNMPLRHINQLAHYNLKPNTLSTFLQSVSSTLQKYCLTIPPNGCIARTNNLFPCKMNALTHLYVSGFQGSLSTLYDAPNLKSLTLTNADVSGMLPTGSTSQFHGCTSVKTVKILSATSALNGNLIMRLADLFPKLTSLHVSDITDDGLDMMYKLMPGLRELNITSDSITDEAICGIPNSNCQEIMETNTFFVVDEYVVRKYLFIGNLIELRSLKIKSDSITDLSVIFGISRTLHLKNLCIESNQITDFSIGSFQRMHLSHLDISGCANIPEISLRRLSKEYKIFRQNLVTEKLEEEIPLQRNLSVFSYKELLGDDTTEDPYGRNRWVHVPRRPRTFISASLVCSKHYMKQTARLEFQETLDEIKAAKNNTRYDDWFIAA